MFELILGRTHHRPPNDVPTGWPSGGILGESRALVHGAILTGSFREFGDCASFGAMATPKKPLLKTRDVLARAGISRQVLYRYIQMELIVPTEITGTGRHLFSEVIFKQITMIQRLNDSGYTLRDIRDIFSRRIRQLK